MPLPMGGGEPPIIGGPIGAPMMGPMTGDDCVQRGPTAEHYWYYSQCLVVLRGSMFGTEPLCERDGRCTSLFVGKYPGTRYRGTRPVYGQLPIVISSLRISIGTWGQ